MQKHTQNFLITEQLRKRWISNLDIIRIAHTTSPTKRMSEIRNCLVQILGVGYELKSHWVYRFGKKSHKEYRIFKRTGVL